MWRLLLTFLVVGFFTPLCADIDNDCVPQSFSVLSELIQRPVSYKEWVHRLMPDKQPANLYDAIHIWNKRMVGTPLICVYWRYRAVDETTLVLNPIGRPDEGAYFWVGKEPLDLTGGTQMMEHAALLYFFDGYVDLVSPLASNHSRYLIEHLTYSEFYARTTAVYKVAPLWKMRWLELIPQH